jgi:hypothetical protein
MKTQSMDTHPDTEHVLIELLRATSSQKKFRLIQGLTRGHIWGKVHGWPDHYPVASEQEAAVLYCSLAYGPDAAASVRAALQDQANWQIQPVDLMAVMQPALQIFDQFGIFAYVGGSLASSLHGMHQLAQDIDLVLDLPDPAPDQLLTAWRTHYAFDEKRVARALQQRTSFSLIHLTTLCKLDLIVPQAGAFDQEMRRLVAPLVFEEQSPPLFVASAAEMILWKLRRYRQYALTARDGMEDDATWNDLLGMMKVQAHMLDYALLDRWATILDLSPFLAQALIDAGALPEPSKKEHTSDYPAA